MKRHSGGARITRVSYGAGMPVDRLRVLIDRLLSAGLLTSEEFEGRPVYDITPRGQEFLDTYWKMRGFVEGFASASPRDPAAPSLNPGSRPSRLTRDGGR
ncbi:MAG: hypothetical protein L3K03_03195 [Thermoplasmata archaeon]|nr:hypothetical protein [Thermoplasmata archaeon]